MKRPIGWHIECAANWKRSLEEQRQCLSSKLNILARQGSDLARYMEQIALAKSKNKTEFDQERFGVKTGPNEETPEQSAQVEAAFDAWWKDEGHHISNGASRETIFSAWLSGYDEGKCKL